MITKATLALYEKDSEGWAIGCELLKEKEPYFIFSLFLPRNEFPSKRAVIHYMLAQILAEVSDDDEAVIFISSLPHFLNSELQRKAGVFAKGRRTIFKRVKQVRGYTVALAIDAVKDSRRYSISEKL